MRQSTPKKRADVENCQRPRNVSFGDVPLPFAPLPAPSALEAPRCATLLTPLRFACNALAQAQLSLTRLP